MIKLSLKLKRLRRVAVVHCVAATMLASLLGAGAPAAGSEIPTWDEIRAAKGNESATAERISEVERLLGDLRQQAGSAGDKAVQAESAHREAVAAFESGKRRLLLLDEKYENAVRTSEELKHRAGGIAAQAYKTGSTSPEVLLLLDADHAVEAANRLAMTNIVGGRTNALYADSRAAESVARSLKEQQLAVQEAVAEQGEETEEALETAESADHRARRAVAEQEKTSALLFAQLAELKGTTAELEQARINGLAAQEAYRQQQEAAREAARNDGGQQDDAAPTSPVPPPAPRPAPTPGNPGSDEPGVPAPQPAPQLPTPPEPAPVPTPQPPQPAPVPSPPPAPEPVVVDDPAAAQAYAQSRMASFGWDTSEFRCLVNLWNRESGWRTSAQNPYSGAYGIPQAYPGSKMQSAGADWRTNFRTQINWGLGYIAGRYGSPCAAWDHSENRGWY